jgi:hypothetical protein
MHEVSRAQQLSKVFQRHRGFKPVVLQECYRGVQ